MTMKSLQIMIVLAIFFMVVWTPASMAVDLVSKSNGLETPDKEEGNTEFETGDINGDGFLDIVSVGDHGSPNFNADEHGIMVWLGNGSGQWTVHQFGSFGYGGCAVGDLNLDGFMDLAWGIHHNYGSGMGDSLLNAALGDGTGASWTEWGQGLGDNGEDWGMFATALADFDCDGRLDIVSQSFGGSNGVRLYRNNGDGTWTQAWSRTGGSVGFSIETCDINADGYPDIACTRSGTEIFLGDGAFGFTEFKTGLPGEGIHGIAVGDINGDGYDDISFGLSSSGVRCYVYESSAQQWSDASNGLPVSGWFDLVQIGDFNGDGQMDIVEYAARTGQIYLGDGAGNWSADDSWTMPAPGDTSAMRVDGDVDHDGREDIFISAAKEGFPFYRNQLRCYSPWSEPSTLSARLTSPHGGETFRNGSIRDIRWLSAIPASQSNGTATILLSVNSDQGPWTPIAEGLPNSGRFQWRVFSDAPSDHCRLRVTIETDQDSVTAESGSDFSILGDPPPATATPTPVPFTPTPTPTPTTGCAENGVVLQMPAEMFRAGDPFYLNAWVCNLTGTTLTGYPLFVILEVYGSYWFAPSWVSMDDGIDYYADLSFPPSNTEITVIDSFSWPDNAGQAQDILFWGAVLTPEMDTLFGSLGQARFGWE